MKPTCNIINLMSLYFVSDGPFLISNTIYFIQHICQENYDKFNYICIHWVVNTGSKHLSFTQLITVISVFVNCSTRVTILLTIKNKNKNQ